MKKTSRANAAARALRAAIAEETQALENTVRQRDVEIARLHAVLRQISGIVGAVPVAEAERKPPVVLPPEEEVPQEPPVDLAGEDDLGPGRWA